MCLLMWLVSLSINPILFDADVTQGTEDKFYKQKQLLPENFIDAAKGDPDKHITLRMQDGYDHSYFFISTFAEDHVAHAAKYLFAL
jgi:S-formylglutathione hydrolase